MSGPPATPRTAPPTDLPAAVLWDMDGTLVDTEPWFTEAVADLVAAGGGALSARDRDDLVGADLWATAAVAIRAGARAGAAEVVEEVVAAVRHRLRGGVPWRPGARELLHAVRAAGIPTALVTMSFRGIAEEVVRSAGPGAFDVVVTGDEVVRGKPDPEAYLRAADLLGVDVRRCVVVEDSPPGVAAGTAAGAAVVAVPGGAALPPDAGRTTWDGLAGRRRRG
ncbi:HAD-IA family hydrolase, partial [Kineococcus sp. T13]|uniref:HAD-IA family hydrolase n=1 Tax=Kineococcus vitellinus TaxID=2696565 RepID=UPI0014131F5A|nr:HAD-IA family hydrolase [Kineococcus vitellinus]